MTQKNGTANTTLSKTTDDVYRITKDQIEIINDIASDKKSLSFFFCLAPYALVVTYLFTKEMNENDFKTVKNKLLNFRDNSISYFVLFVCGCFTIMPSRSFDKSRSAFCVE